MLFLQLFAKNFCSFPPLKLRHICNYASVGRQQVFGSLQDLGWVLAGHKQAGGPLAHLDLMVNLLLQIMVLDRNQCVNIHRRIEQTLPYWRWQIVERIEDEQKVWVGR